MEFVSVLERKNQLEALSVSEELIPLIMRWDDKHISTYISNIRNGEQHKLAFMVEERLIEVEKNTVEQTKKIEELEKTKKANEGCLLWIILGFLGICFPPLFLLYLIVWIVLSVAKLSK